jgi:hypothetical protein
MEYTASTASSTIDGPGMKLCNCLILFFAEFCYRREWDPTITPRVPMMVAPFLVMRVAALHGSLPSFPIVSTIIHHRTLHDDECKFTIVLFQHRCTVQRG